LARRTDNETLNFIGPEDDGLLGALVSVAPNASATVPDAGKGAGQYHVVVAGSMRASDERDDYLERLSCEYVFANDQAMQVTAGKDGLQLLVLRFPTG
jgi:hypothetical protein